MDKTSAKSVLSRIDRRIRAISPAGAKPLSDRAASLRCGLNGDWLQNARKQVKNHRQAAFKVETLEKLSVGLQTSVDWLLKEIGPETVLYFSGHGTAPLDQTQPSIPRNVGEAVGVPLVGFVRAGAEAVYLPLNESEWDRVPAPENATPLTRALEIRGDSLGELFDRWLVYFNDEHRQITPDLVNKLCVLELEDGRTLVKKIKRIGPEAYELLSNTEPPIRGAKIVWAARVIDMRPQ
ncbi:hypothetical protein H8A97_12885 [Bradyrhizobium sp. Arg62]|uniref:S24 family peptidase n=1 Tax=Bradyrhizobium brasilense TaxID=1419277 RepID=UPI001E61CD74|nr:hypothetical protein [Bradyrhizobium brasilense]MCC8945968.1 hypothetical protein [Bradyrhizobium brasilense]